MRAFHRNQVPASTDRVVNVASVPQRSPFRYPGGKTWLVPQVRRWLASRSERATEFFEPFAGGAIVGLTVAFEQLADHVTLVELDEDVASVWLTILGGEAEWLARRVADFSFTAETVAAVLREEAATTRESAFRTILRNRIAHGGILAPGAGVMRRGEGARGLASRWYPQTLSTRILEIGFVRERITFIHGDGFAVMRENAGRSEVAFLIDPPYTAGGGRPGARLYAHCEVNHQELFRIAATLAGDFLMTYHDTPEVRHLAGRHGFDIQTVMMQGRRLTTMRELLVGRDLAWVEPR